jgi:hypothetical protein
LSPQVRQGGVPGSQSRSNSSFPVSFQGKEYPARPAGPAGYSVASCYLTRDFSSFMMSGIRRRSMDESHSTTLPERSSMVAPGSLCPALIQLALNPASCFYTMISTVYSVSSDGLSSRTYTSEANTVSTSSTDPGRIRTERPPSCRIFC